MRTNIGSPSDLTPFLVMVIAVAMILVCTGCGHSPSPASFRPDPVSQKHDWVDFRSVHSPFGGADFTKFLGSAWNRCMALGIPGIARERLAKYPNRLVFLKIPVRGAYFDESHEFEGGAEAVAAEVTYIGIDDKSLVVVSNHFYPRAMSGESNNALGSGDNDKAVYVFSGPIDLREKAAKFARDIQLLSRSKPEATDLSSLDGSDINILMAFSAGDSSVYLSINYLPNGPELDAKTPRGVIYHSFGTYADVWGRIWETLRGEDDRR